MSTVAYFDGNNWSAIRNRAQSIGIVEAQGGDIHVSGHFQQSKVNDGHSTALNLPTYRDTTFSLSSRDISSSCFAVSDIFFRENWPIRFGLNLSHRGQLRSQMGRREMCLT